MDEEKEEEKKKKKKKKELRKRGIDTEIQRENDTGGQSRGVTPRGRTEESV